jgi:hypothetical protein
MAQPPASFPSIPRQSWNYTKAVTRHLVDHPRNVSETVRSERRRCAGPVRSSRTAGARHADFRLTETPGGPANSARSVKGGRRRRIRSVAVIKSRQSAVCSRQYEFTAHCPPSTVQFLTPSPAPSGRRGRPGPPSSGYSDGRPGLGSPRRPGADHPMRALPPSPGGSRWLPTRNRVLVLSCEGDNRQGEDVNADLGPDYLSDYQQACKNIKI